MQCKFSHVIPGQIFWASTEEYRDKRHVKMITVRDTFSNYNAISCDGDFCLFENDHDVEVAEILIPHSQKWI